VINVNTPQQHRDLWLIWLLTFGSLLLAFPAYSIAAFGFDLDRKQVADIFALHVTLSYWLGIFAAFLPLPSLKNRSTFERLQTVCITFMLVSYATHLSWELLWLVFHEAISEARDSIWAYPWWAYIDGGDTRYYPASSQLL
jgi:hypothetical protein